MDALSSNWTDAELSWLWTSTFVFSAVAVSIYGGLISRVRFKRIVPSVYVFFALSFIGFWMAGATMEGNDIVNRIYYVWASIFGLFHLSVFWTYMSDLYSKEQAKRLFGVMLNLPVNRRVNIHTGGTRAINVAKTIDIKAFSVTTAL